MDKVSPNKIGLCIKLAYFFTKIIKMRFFFKNAKTGKLTYVLKRNFLIYEEFVYHFSYFFRLKVVTYDFGSFKENIK